MSSLSKQLERKRREVPWLLVCTIGAFWLCFLFNAWTWGALGRHASAGGIIEKNARSESMLALTYMKSGQWVFDIVGKPDFGAEGISVDYAASLAQIAIEPSVATRIILSTRESWRARLLAWTHYATLPLFVLWIVFTIFRPRTRRTFAR